MFIASRGKEKIPLLQRSAMSPVLSVNVWLITNFSGARDNRKPFHIHEYIQDEYESTYFYTLVCFAAAILRVMEIN